MRRLWTGMMVAWLSVLAVPSFISAQTKLVIGVPHRVFFDVALPMYVAEEKGFYKEEGLTIEPVYVKGGGENVQAVITGDVNIGLATGLFAIFTAFAKGAPVTLVSAQMTGMSEFWYALETSPIRKLEDVAGKKIAYSNPGSSTHMAVLAVIDQLKAKGLKAPEDIALGSPPDTFTAVKTGQADLGWSNPPLFFDRIEKGEIRVVFQASDIAKLRDVTIRANFVNADFAKKNPDAVKKFFRAYQKAVDFIFDKREEAAKIWIRRADLKLSEPMVLKAWDYFSKQAMALKPIKGIQATMEDAIKFKFLKQPLTQAELDRLIDLRYVQ